MIRILTLIFVWTLLSGSPYCQEPEPATDSTATPNGTIVFYSQRDGNAEIYRVNDDGSDLTRLTFEKADDQCPTWSPDGMRIAFSSERDGKSNIYVMQADGSNQVRLTNTPDQETHPDWSPDGKQIAFFSTRNENSDIYVIDVESGEEKRLTKNPATEMRPVWSPDGTKIAFNSDRDGKIEIYCMNRDGTNIKRLTSGPQDKVFPNWSPDGTRIAFMLVDLKKHEAQINLMDADGKNVKEIAGPGTVNENPAWSTDGKQIVFQSNRDGNYEIYIMKANGDNQTPVTRHRAGDYWADWTSPGSQQQAVPQSGQPQAGARQTPQGIDYQQDIVYGHGGDEKLHLDLAKPANLTKPAPCIVVIHGGAWRSGNKRMHKAQIMNFAKQGFVSVTVQYRFCPAHLFPAQIEDVKCAMRYLRAHAPQYHIDPRRIGAIGFSAGAHLSMMLGTMDIDDGLHGDGGWPDQSSKVQAVVSFFGPTELWSPDLPDTSKKLVSDFIGGSADEKRELYRRASPISYLNKGDAPMLLFQGTADPLVPHSQAIKMVEAMTQHDVAGRVEFLIDAGHGWSGDNLTETYRASTDFFKRHLANITER